MTHAQIKTLIRMCAAEAAAKYGARLSDVLGTATTREAVIARQDAMRAIIDRSGCTRTDLAAAWGVNVQSVQRALDEVEPLRPFSITHGAAAEAATRAKLIWLYGPERAARIIAGRDPATQADIASWNNIGRGRAA